MAASKRVAIAATSLPWDWVAAELGATGYGAPEPVRAMPAVPNEGSSEPSGLYRAAAPRPSAIPVTRIFPSS